MRSMANPTRGWRLAAARELALAALGYPLTPLCYTPEDVAEPDGGEILAKDAA